MPILDKIRAIVQRIYRGKDVVLTLGAQKDIARLTELGYDKLPICIAKTQYSFSDDPHKLGAPEDFEINVRSVKVSAGAGFLVVLTGDLMTMPGLPKRPAAENIDVDEAKTGLSINNTKNVVVNNCNIGGNISGAPSQAK